MQPLALAGLRYCEGLHRLQGPFVSSRDAARLARALDQGQINLALAAVADAGDGLIFFLDQELVEPARELARAWAGAQGLPPPRLDGPFVVLTAYPLGRGLALAWRLGAGLLAAGLHPELMLTSPSAAVLVLPGAELAAALAALEPLVALPPGARPTAQQVRVVQVRPGQEPPTVPRHHQPETIAVYREDPIRTYGLQAQAGLAWLRAACAGPDLERALGAAQDLEACPRPLHVQLRLGGDGLELAACLAAEEAPGLARDLARCGLALAEPPRPASLVHLQGPHFGDRHGIAAAALDSLAEAGLTPLSLAGVVHSLFLVLEPDQARAALAALSRRFRAPG
jgi:hypothetical protein